MSLFDHLIDCNCLKCRNEVVAIVDRATFWGRMTYEERLEFINSDYLLSLNLISELADSQIYEKNKELTRHLIEAVCMVSWKNLPLNIRKVLVRYMGQ